MNSLLNSLHLKFIKNLDNQTCKFEYFAMEHLRMSAIYWSLTSLMLLKGKDWEAYSPLSKKQILSFVLECQNGDGGFGGNLNMESHIIFTLSAIQILHLLDSLDEPGVSCVSKYVCELYNRDGSFSGDKYGEIDNRFSYCAVSIWHLVGTLKEIATAPAIEFIIKCQNQDGGFGAIPGAESHAGQSNLISSF